MLTPIANIHRSKLPAPGEIVYLSDGFDRFGDRRYWNGRRQRWIVESYGLNDSADPRYSRGIHCCRVRHLGTGVQQTISGVFCVPELEA